MIEFGPIRLRTVKEIVDNGFSIALCSVIDNVGNLRVFRWAGFRIAY
jgi:hypothetical protein